MIHAGDCHVLMEHATIQEPCTHRCACPGHTQGPSKYPPPRAGSIATRSLGGLAGEAAEIHMGLRGCGSENAIQGRGRDQSTATDWCLHQGTPAPLSEPQFPSPQNQRDRLSAPQRRSHLSRWPCLHGPRTRFGLCPAGSAQKNAQ